MPNKKRKRPQTMGKFKIAHINVQKLAPHVVELYRDLVLAGLPDIVGLAETCLPKHKESTIAIPGYKLHNHPSPNDTEGGVAFLTSENMTRQTTKVEPPNPTWHTVWLELHMGEKTIMAETYLTGALSETQFAEALSSIKINYLWYKSQGYEVILMGDYNVGMGEYVGDKTKGRNKIRTETFENFLATAQLAPR